MSPVRMGRSQVTGNLFSFYDQQLGPTLLQKNIKELVQRLIHA